MLTSNIFLAAIINVCVSISSASNKTNKTSNNLTKDGLHPISHSSEYLLHLKEKCMNKKDLLTDYEKQCCLKMEKEGALASDGFSIINQNTEIMQFGSNVQKSLLEALMRQQSQKPNAEQQTNDGVTNVHSYQQVTQELHEVQNYLAKCSSDKALCSKELTNSALICAQNIAKQEDELKLFQDTFEQLKNDKQELDKEIEKLENDGSHNENRIEQLTKELENAVKLRMDENTLALNVTVQLAECKTESNYVGEAWTKCKSDRDRLEPSLESEKRRLASCMDEQKDLTEEVAKLDTVHDKLQLMQNNNSWLQQALERCQKAIHDKDGQLKSCAQTAATLQQCQMKAASCHKNITETQEEWMDKYYKCSNQMATSTANLANAKESLKTTEKRADELEEQLEECHKKFGDLANEYEHFMKENNRLKEKISAMENDMEDQFKKLTSSEKQHQNCITTNENLFNSFRENDAKLLKELDVNERLRAELHEQTKRTMSERKRKEECENNAEEMQEDKTECLRILDECRGALNKRSSDAQECGMDLGQCSGLLQIAENARKNCSSRPTGTELDKWKVLYEECQAKHGKCEKSHTEFAKLTNDLRDKNGHCLTKLDHSKNNTVRCQDSKDALVNSLKVSSDALANALKDVQRLTSQEAASAAALKGTQQHWTACGQSLTAAENTKKKCLAELGQSTEKVGELETSNSQMNTSLAKHESDLSDCSQHLSLERASLKESNAKAMACENTLNDTVGENGVLRQDLEQCRHNRNLTTADSTERQQLYQHCKTSKQETEQRYQNLTKRCESDEEKYRADELQRQLSACKNSTEILALEKKRCTINLRQSQNDLSLTNSTKNACEAELSRCSTSLASQSSTAEATVKQMNDCTTKLTACLNPVYKCPDTVGDEVYWKADRPGRGPGCIMLSKIRTNGQAMQHYCEKQHGTMFMVSNLEDLSFAHRFVANSRGKFLVDPSTYLVKYLDLPISQYDSKEAVCYSVENSGDDKHVFKQLTHHKCAEDSFGAICWAKYQKEEEEDNGDYDNDY